MAISVVVLSANVLMNFPNPLLGLEIKVDILIS